MTVCPNRAYKSSWHPGWKAHALKGHLMAIAVIEQVEDAVADLKKDEPEVETLDEAETRLQALLNKLDAEEQKDYDAIFHSPMPDDDGKRSHGIGMWLRNNKKLKQNNQQLNAEIGDSIKAETLLTSAMFCRTARLPSQSRYMGLMTEDFSLTTTDPTNEHYYHGISWEALEKEEKNNKVYTDPNFPGEMVLTKIHEHKCEGGPHLEIDRKDFYYVSSMMGERSLTLPNDSEANYYTEWNSTIAQGLVFICPAKCNWGKCPPEDAQKRMPTMEQDEKYGFVNITVNDVEVGGYSGLGGQCYALFQKNNSPTRYNWAPNDQGKYVIKVKFEGAKSRNYLKLSSFILV